MIKKPAKKKRNPKVPHPVEFAQELHKQYFNPRTHTGMRQGIRPACGRIGSHVVPMFHCVIDN